MSRLLALLLLWLAGGSGAAADEVTIYRCTDAGGHLTLRDTPCRKGQTQQTRTMVRPKDAPLTQVVPAPPAPAPSAPATPPPSVMVVHTPRPLYECVPPDGAPYTSDTPEGHPRWVPLWTLGIPYGNGLTMTQNGSTMSYSNGPHPHPHPRPGFYGFGAYPAGTWIRDDCHALPQAEVCARLVDRRDEIRRRFFNAMPSERDTLRVEERGIDARLDADCGSNG